MRINVYKDEWYPYYGANEGDGTSRKELSNEEWEAYQAYQKEEAKWQKRLQELYDK